MKVPHCLSKKKKKSDCFHVIVIKHVQITHICYMGWYIIYP